MSPHTLSNFDSALAALRADVLMMGSLAERSLDHSAKGVFERDSDLCNIAIADDEEIDLLEMSIDSDGVQIITRFQPVASDLRHIISCMKLSQNIERVGDAAVTIARRGKKLNQCGILKDIHRLDSLFSTALRMYKDALRAFADLDLGLARSLKPRDRELDRMNNEAVEAFTACMQKDPESVAGYLNCIFIARSLERVGDHATNIAEDCVFVSSAEDIRHLEKKKEEES